jgi:hypothetical protein
MILFLYLTRPNHNISGKQYKKTESDKYDLFKGQMATMSSMAIDLSRQPHFHIRIEQQLSPDVPIINLNLFEDSKPFLFDVHGKY